MTEDCEIRNVEVICELTKATWWNDSVTLWTMQSICTDLNSAPPEDLYFHLLQNCHGLILQEHEI